MQENEISIIKALKYILSIKEKIYLLYIVVLVLVGAGLELLGVAIFTPFIETFTQKNSSQESTILQFFNNFFRTYERNDFIIIVATSIIVIYLVKNFFLIYEKNTVYKFSYSLQQRISKRLIKSYMKMPYTFHLNTNPSELIRTIQIDADNFTKTVIHVIELIMEIVVCIALVIYLFIVSPTITMVTASFLFLAVISYVSFSRKKLRSIGRKSQQYGADVFKYMNQSFGGIKEIKVLGREDFFVKQFSGALTKNVQCLRIARLASVLPKYFIEAVCIVSLMIAVILMTQMHPDSMESLVPQLAVFATAAFRLMPSVGRINEHTAAINSNFPSVMLIYYDLKRVEDRAVSQDLTCVKKENDDKLELSHEIQIDNVDFRYPDSDRNIIDNASFCIPKGQTIAFVGESGAGKTTMADIILGILQPNSGKIMVDGVDVNSDLPKWQRNIGYIPQTIYLSDDTIRNNIAFGISTEDIDENAVIEAAKKAQLFDFIETLPEGLDTVVGERGARLSGGQRQRIGIARALYHNPEILVLDEATSALDNETETAVMESIDGLHGLKTMIIIAHRLSTIANSDIIYEVGNGKVIVKSKEEVLK